MSRTETINPSSNGNNKDGKKKCVKTAASVAAGTSLGVAGTALASELEANNENEEVLEILDDQDTTLEEQQSVENPSSNSSISSSSTGVSSSPSHQSVVVEDEPQPITSNDEGEEDSEVIEVDETDESDETESGNYQPSETEVEVPAGLEIENPDEIADAIIAENMVDPNDIDMDDVINFDEIGTVYTVNGESYTAAAFHDSVGNQLVMVDVDGDNVFDVVTDYDGNLISEVPGGITVDDAEINMADDNTYLAHKDDEDVDQYGANSISCDLIS